jgi:hypothetical protein
VDIQDSVTSLDTATQDGTSALGSGFFAKCFKARIPAHVDAMWTRTVISSHQLN